ncbi:MAG: hypothetical protein IT195_13750, partial [Microthrixaceae bacterium]|nr:hypothetical protein [Microthrixaceae bacterium]
SFYDAALAHEEGRHLFRSWSKVPSQTTASGIWFDLSMSPGNPKAQYYFSSPLEAAQLSHSIAGGIDHGGNVGPTYKKYIRTFAIQTVTATAAVNTFQLLDYLLYYPGITMDVGVTELTNVATLPRYTDGDGVQIMVIEQNPYVGSARFQLTYTNQDGTAGRVTPIARCNTQAISGTIATSTTATVEAHGRFMALQGTDTGVRSVESIEFLSGDVGLLCIVLVRPLATFRIFESTAPNYYDMLKDCSCLPCIEDDAYLNLICMPTGTLASAQIVGDLTTIWTPA